MGCPHNGVSVIKRVSVKRGLTVCLWSVLNSDTRRRIGLGKCLHYIEMSARYSQGLSLRALIWCGRQLSDYGESVSFGLKVGIFKHAILASIKWETLQCGNLRSGPISAVSIYSLLRGRAKIGPNEMSVTLVLLQSDFSPNADWSFKQCKTIWLAIVRFAFPARILFVKRKENRAWSQVTK